MADEMERNERFLLERFPFLAMQQQQPQQQQQPTAAESAQQQQQTKSCSCCCRAKLRAVPVADGAVDADWQKKKLCALSHRAFAPRSDGRVPGQRPCAADVTAVRFSPAAEFRSGEVCLVARCRGGLVYAVVESRAVVQRCYLDADAAHPSVRFRVAFPSVCDGRSEKLFKDMPPHYIGKLPKRTPEEAKQQQQQQQQQPANAFEAARVKRVVGTPVEPFDIANACFSPASAFAPGQMVAVPRSAGGFSYGVVLKRHIAVCSAVPDAPHEIVGWRVVVRDATATEPRVFKDLPAGVIGKLVLITETPAPRPALLAPQPLSIQRPAKPEDASAQEGEASTSAAAACGAAVADEFDDDADLGETFLWTGGCIEEGEVASDDEDDEGDARQCAHAPKRRTSESDEDVEEKEEEVATATPSPTPHRGGMLQVSEAQTKPVQQQQKPKPAPQTLPPIVIDGPNVAVKHSGKKSTLSVAGIRIAIEYYQRRGHDVVAFVPEYYYTRKPLPSSTCGLSLGDFMPVVDSMPAFESLVQRKLVVLTPPQDYDDVYCIEYARKHGAYIVTNDRYNDHINKMPSGSRAQRELRQWIRRHCISFTFVRDEFFPNPDFAFSSR